MNPAAVRLIYLCCICEPEGPQNKVLQDSSGCKIHPVCVRLTNLLSITLCLIFQNTLLSLFFSSKDIQSIADEWIIEERLSTE